MQFAVSLIKNCQGKSSYLRCMFSAAAVFGKQLMNTAGPWVAVLRETGFQPAAANKAVDDNPFAQSCITVFNAVGA